MMRRHSLIVVFLMCLSLQFTNDVLGEDLTLLFAGPTEGEITAVEQEWADRSVVGTDFLIERTAEENGFTIARVSFRYEGLKQYALLRYPRNYLPQGTYPLLMVHHGSTYGFYYTFGFTFDDEYPTGCLADECFVLIPTYRGEGFAAGEVLGNAISQGEKSVWDKDCDDAMALLTAALVGLPQVDPTRLLSWGRSRGGGVAYKMAIRDPRLYRSAVFFGPTDFFQENIRQDIQATMDGGPVPTNTLSIKVWDFIVSPWLAGEFTLAEARFLLIAWSSIYFVNPTASLQIHHGQDDENIPVVHAENFAAIMMDLGATAPEFELFTYPGGTHDTGSLYGNEEITEEYLCLPDEVAQVPVRVLGPALEAWPNPFAKTVLIQASDPAKGSTGDNSWVQIFDVRGRLIGSIALPAGEAVQWDGTDLLGRRVGAGLYFMKKSDTPGVPLKVLLLP